MARKKQTATETESEPEKPKPGKKREPVKKSGPATKPGPGKKPDSKKPSLENKKQEPVEAEPAPMPEPIPESLPVSELPEIEQERSGEHAGHFSAHRTIPPEPRPGVSANMLAGAGFCTFVGAVIFSYGLSIRMTSVILLGAIIGIAGYLQVILIIKRSHITVLFREHFFPWFVLVTVIISSVIFGVQLADLTRSRSRPSETLSDAAPTPTPPADDSTRVLPDGRVLLVGVTPEYLSGLTRRYNTSEVEQMMRPYWKKWIRIEGVVKDINNDKSESGAVISRLIIEGTSASSPVSITYFSDAKQIERLGQLKKRAPVKAMCQITRRYSAGDYTFENCELVD